jgi:hypothetical protein
MSIAAPATLHFGDLGPLRLRLAEELLYESYRRPVPGDASATTIASSFVVEEDVPREVEWMTWNCGDPAAPLASSTMTSTNFVSSGWKSQQRLLVPRDAGAS